MVSLAYLVKRRSVEPENRVRSPEIPQIIKSHSSIGWSIDLIRRRVKVRVLLRLQKQSHSSNGQSTGLLNRGLKVQIFLGLQWVPWLNGQSMGFLNPGLQVRVLSESQKESRQILDCCGLLLMSSTTVVKVRFLCSPQKGLLR